MNINFYVEYVCKKGGLNMQKWLILGVVLIIVILTTVIVFNMEIETDYTPEEEISCEELRKTSVSVYFKNKASNTLVKENILIDSKKLLKDPYNEFVTMLINGSDNEKFESVFPENIKMPSVNFEKGVVSVEFSKDSGILEEGIDLEIIRTALFDTLKQLSEVEFVRILVEGQEL